VKSVRYLPPPGVEAKEYCNIAETCAAILYSERLTNADVVKIMKWMKRWPSNIIVAGLREAKAFFVEKRETPKTAEELERFIQRVAERHAEGE
jgi:hypothetical protein